MEQLAILELSDIFLDRDLETMELTYIAHRLLEIGFNDDKIRNLVVCDLFPVLWSNLVSVAGIWDMFEPAWLLDRVDGRRRSWWRRTVAAPADWVA